MGLGKTIQVIAFFAAILNKNGLPSDLDSTLLDCIKKQKTLNDSQISSSQSSSSQSSQSKTTKRFLVCCPASVMTNWTNELDKWGYFAISKFHSSQERLETRRKLDRGRCEVVVTSHETARAHMDELTQYEWSAVVVDEFHKIKNDKTPTSRAFHEFTTRTRIGLSGTILQNDLIELWTLLDWVNPGCLGPKEVFKMNYVKPILMGQRQNATKIQLLRKLEKTEVLKKLKKQWVLRRTKQIISHQMPQKIDKVVYCRLSDFQISIIKRLRESECVQFLLKRNEPCKCGSTYYTKDCNCYQHLAKHKRKLLLKLLSAFMKLANHPGLFIEGLTNHHHHHANEDEKDADADEIDAAILEAIPSNLRNGRSSEFFSVRNCGKMRVLESLLDALRQQNAKVLLFSHSVRLLDIIESQLIGLRGYSHLRLDGTTKTSARQQIVDDFNRDENIFLFLISTKAGGMGLNITGANVVIIFDPNWNPTHDQQAQDRAYRIGQKRDVHVYRLISSGCIEENIYLRQIYKMHLSKECVEDADSRRLFNLSANNKRGEFLGIENLFDLDEGVDHCKTRDILKRYSAIEKGIAGLEVSNFVHTTPLESQTSEEDSDVARSKESNDDDDDDDDDGEDEFFCYDGKSFLDSTAMSAQEDNEMSDEDESQGSSEDLIDKILRKDKHIVHIHQDKDVSTSSKIESHVRKCLRDEVVASNNISSNVGSGLNAQQNAFNCFVQPQLSTLDYVELDKVDFELASKSLKRDKVNKFELSDGSFVHYGNVPNDIKREQFREMAKRLKMSVDQLATSLMSWTPEERFAGLKRFYISTCPKSVEFYESFSKLKKTTKKPSSDSSKDRTDSANHNVGKFRPDEVEKVDYYENLNTFENVLELIEDEKDLLPSSNSKSVERIATEGEKTSRSRPMNDDIDSLYEQFMNSKSDIDVSLVRKSLGTGSCSNSIDKPENLSLSETKPQVCKEKLETPKYSAKSANDEMKGQEKYDKLFDDLFE